MFEEFYKKIKQENISDQNLLMLSDLDFGELRVSINDWQSLSSELRQEIVIRISEMAEESVDLDFTSILRLALDDPESEIKESAIAGLWESEERKLIPKLCDMLREDSELSVRVAAAINLGHFALMSVTGKLLDKDGQRIYAPLIDALSDENESIELRRRALESISVFQTDDATNWILWAYREESDQLKQSSVFSMGKSCNPIWIPTIVEELNSEDPAMRYEAAIAAGEQMAESTVPILIEMLADTDIEVRSAVIQSLGIIGGSSAKKALQALLESEDDFTREIVQESLKVADLDQSGMDMRP